MIANIVHTSNQNRRFTPSAVEDKLIWTSHSFKHYVTLSFIRVISNKPCSKFRSMSRLDMFTKNIRHLYHAMSHLARCHIFRAEVWVDNIHNDLLNKIRDAAQHKKPDKETNKCHHSTLDMPGSGIPRV